MKLFEQELRALVRRCREAAGVLSQLDAETKNACLLAMADGIEQSQSAIQEANRKDLEASRAAGLSSAILDRLLLNKERIVSMAEGIRAVASLNDPVGEVIRDWTRPSGIRIRKIRVPLGVLLIIYESRPNVTADAACLCVKAGNAVILRGGSEAIHSNRAIAKAMMAAARLEGLLEDSVAVVPVTDRAAVDTLLQMEGMVDLCIPRGGEGLIRAVAEKSRIPVIKHYKGLCSLFVERGANLKMAEAIVLNAKCQRAGVCNAIETLLVDAKIAGVFLPRMILSLQQNGVQIRGDAKTRELIAGDGTIRLLAPIRAASEEDWSTEFLDLVLAVRVVEGLEQAIDHILVYGSAHSDCIVTNDRSAAEKFLRKVDSSSVFWNASTRLADGGQYGFGAEIGISTDKLHARGPMGLEELTSYKYVVSGEGQIRE